MLLAEKKIIITGGPTREWIDPVRYISNESSGKMGAAIALAAASLSKRVVFIHGPVSSSVLEEVSTPGISKISIETTEELLEAVLNEITDDSVLIMAAAPADYRPEAKQAHKIKKNSDTLTLRLTKNPDILKKTAEKRKTSGLDNLFTVGFAAETTDLEKYALSKLEEKELDMICLNDVSRKDIGFRTDHNELTVFTKNGKRFEIPFTEKRKAAERILQIIENELNPC